MQGPGPVQCIPDLVPFLARDDRDLVPRAMRAVFDFDPRKIPEDLVQDAREQDDFAPGDGGDDDVVGNAAHGPAPSQCENSTGTSTPSNSSRVAPPSTHSRRRPWPYPPATTTSAPVSFACAITTCAMLCEADGRVVTCVRMPCRARCAAMSAPGSAPCSNTLTSGSIASTSAEPGERNAMASCTARVVSRVGFHAMSIFENRFAGMGRDGTTNTGRPDSNSSARKYAWAIAPSLPCGHAIRERSA